MTRHIRVLMRIAPTPELAPAALLAPARLRGVNIITIADILAPRDRHCYMYNMLHHINVPAVLRVTSSYVVSMGRRVLWRAISTPHLFAQRMLALIRRLSLCCLCLLNALAARGTYTLARLRVI